MNKRAGLHFDCRQLTMRIDRFGRDEILRGTGIGGARLERLLRGETDFRQGEIHALSRLLALTADEVRLCFFTPESSENLNHEKELCNVSAVFIQSFCPDGNPEQREEGYPRDSVL